jgi:hypothetical protein
MSTPTFSYNFFIMSYQSQTTFTIQTNLHKSTQVKMLPADAPKYECFLPTLVQRMNKKISQRVLGLVVIKFIN